jgi:LPXTG-motif cell wall-anchored protein
MTIRRGRGCRAVSPSLCFGGSVLVALASVLGVPGLAGAGEGTISDPRELGTQLDVKTLTHTDDGSSVVYTAETYAPFTDQSAAFQWGIDRDGDEDFDLFTFTEWRGGKLVGGVKDATGREVSGATVSRPGPNAIKVSFPVAALGGAGVYRYAVNAGATGGDLAPDAGLSQHRIGSVAGPSGAATRAAGATAPAEAAPAKAAATEAAPAEAGPAQAAATEPGPAVAAPAPRPSLPTTGPGDGNALVPVAGAALMLGGSLIAAGSRRVRRS